MKAGYWYSIILRYDSENAIFCCHAVHILVISVVHLFIIYQSIL